MKKTSTRKSHYEQINLALAHIHFNFGEKITAEDLAVDLPYLLETRTFLLEPLLDTLVLVPLLFFSFPEVGPQT